MFYTPVGTSYFQFSIAEYTVSETAGNASVTVTRVGDLSDTATVRYTATDGTAVNGRDYRAVTGTLAFAPGQDNATITVPILRDAVRRDRGVLVGFRELYPGKGGHIVTVIDLGPDAVRVIDSDDGDGRTRTMSRDGFFHWWDGFALVLNPD